ncbi:hypothetical protein scyTo_0009686 [Scyliorhinus torazame]|uniref:Peptidase M14 domain-containing protein n=1 Tax=Scyliorhinus torazame TaxID=75743 RepID=A0A401NRW5_SCYTO|nr:hypothetical protein [Scyliorhinus torazame]
MSNVLETYTADPNTDRFLEHIDFYILPVLNIDGYVYSWLKDRLWRKSRSPCANSTCFGTDLNRNYDAKWCNYLSGSSQDWAGDLQIDFSYTFELRDNGTYHFILPENQIQATCEETMAAVTTIIEHIYDKHFLNAAPAVVALWSGVLASCFLSTYFVNLL